MPRNICNIRGFLGTGSRSTVQTRRRSIQELCRAARGLRPPQQPMAPLFVTLGYPRANESVACNKIEEEPIKVQRDSGPLGPAPGRCCRPEPIAPVPRTE